ncbi:beta-N-acetylglucosaminidase [Corynebacterium striatum]
MRFASLTRSARVAAACVAATCVLTACGDKEEAPAPQAPETTAPAKVTPAKETSSSAAPTTEESAESRTESATSKAAESESADPSASATASESANESGSAKTDKKLAKPVEEAYKTFGELIPVEIFQQFDRCDPNGVEDSYNCSGSEVGQFQFFKNKSKAAQTTQVLTELRSSRVIKDEGDRVVGWSMLGNTAILTVVDNKEGLVMQQMISTDQDDPEDRLKELGLI